MSKNIFLEWKQQFWKDAAADKLTLFREHLKKLGLPDKPKQLLEGTILAVQACCAYAQIGGRSYDDFLAMQKYDISDAINAKYEFTFDIFGMSYARVLTSKELAPFLDLADLYEQPWNKYEVCGYNEIWVSRTDGKALTAREKAELEKNVIADLRFDYSEDELGFWFDDSTIEGVLRVYVYDVGEEEND